MVAEIVTTTLGRAGANAHAGNNLECFLVAGDCWLRCSLETAHRRLIDYLNADPLGVVVTSRGWTVPEGRHSEPPTGRARAWCINPASILLGIPVEEAVVAGGNEHRRIGWVNTKEVRRVLLRVGPYELEGNAHLLEGSSLADVYLTGGGQYLALTSVEVKRPGGSWEGREPVVIVNRSHIQAVAPMSA